MTRGQAGRRDPALACGSDAVAWRLRGHLYRKIRESGVVPGRAGLRKELGVEAVEVDRALRFLADAHVLALDQAGEVWMAHPFSAVPTPYRVETPVGDYWANCAWDAIAIPLILGTDGRTPTVCPHSGVRFDLTNVGRRVGPEGSVVRLPVPARDFWDDIGFT
ncbi:MAG: organomercurial lyase [Gemmatimonadetes bacterium]|nr:organomercurial lyase [Gemmatimonadota bacterium]